jgi:hypothetical protein
MLSESLDAPNKMTPATESGHGKHDQEPTRVNGILLALASLSLWHTLFLTPYSLERVSGINFVIQVVIKLDGEQNVFVIPTGT